MSEFFMCDPSIFQKEPFMYLKDRNTDNIINYLETKHAEEINAILEVDIKKSDLIIWNALLAKEVSNSGTTTEEIAKYYNYYYTKILTTTPLFNLHKLEIDMFLRYVNILINIDQTTPHLLVNKILHYIHINIENYISLDTLASSLTISPSYASSIFKEKMGISLIKYSKQVKIERAKVLLLTTDESILSISSKLAFHDQSHFCHTFKKFVGMTPVQFKNANGTIDK